MQLKLAFATQVLDPAFLLFSNTATLQGHYWNNCHWWKLKDSCNYCNIKYFNQALTLLSFVNCLFSVFIYNYLICNSILGFAIRSWTHLQAPSIYIYLLKVSFFLFVCLENCMVGGGDIISMKCTGIVIITWCLLNFFFFPQVFWFVHVIQPSFFGNKNEKRPYYLVLRFCNMKE